MGAFDADIQVFVDAMGPAAAEFLREAALAEEQKVESEQSARRGIAPFTHIAVDGIEVTDFSSVKATSVVFEYWDYRSEIIKACFEELRARSPIQSGHYRDNFYAALDGRDLRPLEVPQPFDLRNVTQIIVSNLMPYARRLEVGVNRDGSYFVKQVDPMIVETAMGAVAREFRSVAHFQFGYIDHSLAYANATKWGNHRHGRHYRNRGTGAAVRYPAILINLV
jgi:hypothetical protein